MTDLKTLDQAFAFIMGHFIDTGRGPHYPDLGRALGLEMEVARDLFREVVNGQLHSSWLEEGTDYIYSFAPFNNLPTPYLVSVDGAQRWFAQCGLEATSIRLMFPGRLVRVDCTCLTCGAPLVLEARDDEFLVIDTPEMVGYSAAPLGDLRPEGHSERCGLMHLFCSEDHARRWGRFNPVHEENLKPVGVWAERFGSEYFRNRLRPDYLTWIDAFRRAHSAGSNG